MAGQVRVEGQVVSKASANVVAGARIELEVPDHPYVSRGGVKLAHALDDFTIDPAGKRALDVGASTGGFTDCLLQRGAARVTCVDVGQGQLDWKLASDARVRVLDRVNIRLAPPDLLPERVDLVVIDVSFISLRLVLPALPPLAKPGAPVVALVKPQFEVGRADVGKGGIVRDEAARARALAEVRAAAAALGYTVGADTVSPITGGKGNVEFLLSLRAPGAPS
jgi:23S rRNA (cytidine1920-2'-O)/16S rRNA (cytidine1409-2'-O)-methyltransferase